MRRAPYAALRTIRHAVSLPKYPWMLVGRNCVSMARAVASCAKLLYQPATSMDCKIAEGMVTFFESYERELEKYWTGTLFFQFS